MKRSREHKALQAARLLVQAEEELRKAGYEVSDWNNIGSAPEFLEVELRDKETGSKIWYKIRR